MPTVTFIQRCEFDREMRYPGATADVPETAVDGLVRAGVIAPVAGRAQSPETAVEVPVEPSGPCSSCPDEERGRHALSVCSTPGCGCRVVTGACRGCRRAHDRKRNTSAQRRAYKAPRWHSTRARVLRERPYCECDDCLRLPDILRPQADVVDHIKGDVLGPLGYTDSNLRPMLAAHHNKRTMRDQVH